METLKRRGKDFYFVSSAIFIQRINFETIWDGPGGWCGIGKIKEVFTIWYN